MPLPQHFYFYFYFFLKEEIPSHTHLVLGKSKLQLKVLSQDYTSECILQNPTGMGQGKWECSTFP